MPSDSFSEPARLIRTVRPWLVVAAFAWTVLSVGIGGLVTGTVDVLNFQSATRRAGERLDAITSGLQRVESQLTLTEAALASVTNRLTNTERGITTADGHLHDIDTRLDRAHDDLAALRSSADLINERVLFMLGRPAPQRAK
jgi:hypothetical protein